MLSSFKYIFDVKFFLTQRNAVRHLVLFFFYNHREYMEKAIKRIAKEKYKQYKKEKKRKKLI
jgi:hypothetical protein